MKKTKAVSNKWSMLSVIALSALISCKKETVSQPERIRTNSTARVFTEPEVTALATQVNHFAYYADDYFSNTGAAIPAGLESFLSVDKAIGLLENTYNFIYSERTDSLYKDSVFTTEITIPLNINGTISI